MVSRHSPRERLELTQAHVCVWAHHNLIIFHGNFPQELSPSWLWLEGQRKKFQRLYPLLLTRIWRERLPVGSDWG